MSHDLGRRRRLLRPRQVLAVLAALMMVATACSEPLDEDDAAPAASTETEASAPTAEPADDSSPDPDDDTSAGADAGPEIIDDGSVVFDFAGEDWFLGEVPSQGIAADASLEPLKIGMINQENTPLGSFPEMRGAAQAAVAWVNAELGGVDGRPIELITCITSFSVEQSQACAQDMVQAGVVALVGGIDVTSNGSIPVLEQNGIPSIGGIPANLVEQRSAVNFFFSGGGSGAMAAFVAHAAENGASKVMIAYGQFESFEVAARDYGAAVGESLGLEVELLPFPITSSDMLPILTAAKDSDVDALVIAAADSACVPAMTGAVQLELRAQLYLTGACAADPIVEATGEDITGVVFNSEGPLEDTIEGDLYQAVIDQYAGATPAGGAGTVGFRGFMNLYGLLVEIGGDDVSSEAILTLVRAADDRTSFWGHAYTCDGARVFNLPALCAPEQTLFMLTGVVGDPLIPAYEGWIETDDLFAAVGG